MFGLGQGTVQLTPDQVKLQQRSAQELQQYWSTEAPALSAAIQAIRGGPGAAEERAAGEGVASADERTAAALGQIGAQSGAAGVSGNALAARTGGALIGGARDAASAAVAGRSSGRGAYIDRLSRVVGAGTSLLNKADSALATGASLQAAQYQAAQADKTQQLEDFGQLAVTLGGLGRMGSNTTGGVLPKSSIGG